MTVREAYRKIREEKDKEFERLTKFFSDEEKALEEDCIKISYIYESLLKRIIAYHFMDLYPETFLICYVTGDEYKALNSDLYKWYMKMINGDFKNFLDNEEISDVNIYNSPDHNKNRELIYKNRFKIAKQIFEKIYISFPKDNVDIKNIIWFVVSNITPGK